MIDDPEVAKLEEAFKNALDPNLLYEESDDDDDSGDSHHHHHNE